MLTLVLGGTRSGKSAWAERVVAADEARTGGTVTYVATAAVEPGDKDHTDRVEAHRARRPTTWTTAECAAPGDLLDHLQTLQGTVLVDSLGSWLVRHHDFAADPEAVLDALRTRGRRGLTVLVSEEVGLAVHPTSPLGRRYVDALGTLNQKVATIADRVVLVVAGRALELPSSDPPGTPEEPDR